MSVCQRLCRAAGIEETLAAGMRLSRSFALPALHLVVSQCHWGGAGIFNRVQPGDQLLVEVTAFGQWPAAATVEDLRSESETGVEAAVGVILRRTSDVTAEHERWL